MLRGPGCPWRAMNRARAQLDRVIFAEIERRRASGERGADILSLLLDAEDEDGSRLSDRELRDQVMTLLFAGHDTTTSTVTFLFYELARNPDEIAPGLAGRRGATGRARARAAPRHGGRRDPAHVPAGLDRAATLDRAVRAPRRDVPGGVFVNYCSWASHHLPDVFPRALAVPARALRARASAPSCPRAPTCPFGGGSRTCIGMRFGQLEVKAIATTILRRFTLELAEPTAASRSARCRRCRRAAVCRWWCASAERAVRMGGA